MLHFTFSELKASTNYHVSIIAVNSIGPSKPTTNFTVKTNALSMYVAIAIITKYYMYGSALIKYIAKTCGYDRAKLV